MSESKGTYRGYTQTQNRATQKYIKEHLDNIQLRVPKGMKDYYKAAAKAIGNSLNEFAVSSMDEKIKREKLETEQMQEIKNISRLKVYSDILHNQ